MRVLMQARLHNNFAAARDIQLGVSTVQLRHAGDSTAISQPRTRHSQSTAQHCACNLNTKIKMQPKYCLCCIPSGSAFKSTSATLRKQHARKVRMLLGRPVCELMQAPPCNCACRSNVRHIPAKNKSIKCQAHVRASFKPHSLNEASLLWVQQRPARAAVVQCQEVCSMPHLLWQTNTDNAVPRNIWQ